MYLIFKYLYMSTDDKSYYFHNLTGASKLVHGKEKNIKAWNVRTMKYIKLGLRVQDLSSEIETKCLTAVSAFCYK